MSTGRRFEKEKRFQYLILLFAVVAICCVAAYHFTPGGNSDEVEGVLWADATLRSGRLVSTTYQYPYAIPVGANVIFLPYVAALGISQTANMLGMFTFFLILAATAGYFMKGITDRWIIVIAGIAVFMCSFCSVMEWNLAHHILYYQLGMMCFLGMVGACFHIIKPAEKKKTIHYALLLFFAIWGGANGTPSIVLAGAPAIVAIMGSKVLFDDDTLSWKKIFRLIGWIAVGTAVGYGIYRFAMRGITETGYLDDTGSFVFQPASEWIENLRKIPSAWLNLFLIKPPEGVEAASADGIFVLLCVLVSVLTFLIPLICVCRIRKHSPVQQMVMIGGLAIWAVCLLEFVCLRGAEQRMLYNGIFANFMLIAACIPGWISSGQKKTRLLTIVFAMILGVFSLLFVCTGQRTINKGLVSELEKKGLENGFGTFWNANLNTVNSDGKVKIRNATFHDGMVWPEYFQSDTTWYEQPEVGGKWFIVLNEEEFSRVDQELYESTEETYTIGGYHVMVYVADDWEYMVKQPE